MIKIISGKYRSRNLETPLEGTLPTKNIVREAMASSVCGIVRGSNVLDVFAGSGALGIEALSCGAAKATFIEKSPKAASIIKSNLASLGESANTVICQDYEIALSQLKGEKFDIVFVDPPYANKESYGKVLSFLLDNLMVNDGGIIIFEYEGACPLDYSTFAKAKEHKFGKSKFLVLKK